MSLALDVGVSRVADHVRKGECILFLGAGVHSSPGPGVPYTYPDAERPPLGGELSRLLSSKCSFQKDYPKGNTSDLAKVSLYFEYEKKRKALIDEVHAAVSVGKVPSPALRGLAALNFPLIITTNYDQLLEMALAEHRKAPVKKVYDKRREAESTDFAGEESAAFPFLFKIHGDVADRESVVITDEDYIHFMLRMGDASTHSPIPETLRYRFKKYATLFIGYSLLDYNLRVLFKTLQWRLDPANRPAAYSVDPFPDTLIQQYYGVAGDLVNFIVEDVWAFVPMLYKELLGKDMPQ